MTKRPACTPNCCAHANTNNVTTGEQFRVSGEAVGFDEVVTWHMTSINSRHRSSFRLFYVDVLVSAPTAVAVQHAGTYVVCLLNHLRCRGCEQKTHGRQAPPSTFAGR